MKPTELQIGDYVFIKSLLGGYHTIPIRIAAVHQKKVGYHNRIDRLSWVRHGMLVPIPLTTELLERNGFNKVSQQGCSNPYYWMLEKYEEESEELLYRIKAYKTMFRGMYVSIDNYADCEPIKFSKQIEHFHELQHTLRLCDLNELTDNLKVE